MPANLRRFVLEEWLPFVEDEDEPATWPGGSWKPFKARILYGRARLEWLRNSTRP